MSNAPEEQKQPELSPNAQTALAAVLALPSDEQVRIAGFLNDTLSYDFDPLNAIQLEEIERRIADSDESRLIPLARAMEMARNRQMP